MLRLIAVLLMSGWWMGASAAGVYRWVDEQGNVHFGDKPHGVDAEEVQIKSPPRSETPAQNGTVDRERLLRALEAERLERAEQRQARERERAEREQRCFEARDDLRRLETAGVVYELDSDGRRRVLSDSERGQALAAARARVQRWCD